MSLNQLTLDQRKPWLSVRAENIDVDGEFVIAGDNVASFTPTLIVPDGTTTYTVQRGRYAQYGKMLTIWLHVACTSTTGGSHPIIFDTNLDYTSLNINLPQIGSASKQSAAPSLAGGSTGLYARAVQNTSQIEIYEGRAGAGTAVLIPGSTAFDIAVQITVAIN